MTPPPRAILSLILIVGMMTIVRFGEQMIVKAMSILVFPFVGVLMLLALYLIRSGTAQHWKRCLWTLHCNRERSVDDPVAGNSGNGVLVQPLSNHLFFRRCEA